MRLLAIVRDFADCASWEERYQRLIKVGRELPPLPDELKVDEAKVRGCSSSVWLHASRDQAGLIRLQADSDA
ncbi:MAG: SufE family protein, partial [Planctomycetota bacterium]